MLSKEEIRYIAGLSRIHLEEQEVEFLTRNLADILHYIEKLKKADITGIQPTPHVLPLKNVYREDQIQPSLPPEDVQKISQHHIRGFFKVPQVIE